MRQKNRDSQSLIPKPLSPDHKHGLSVSTDSKTRKGRSIPTAPLFFYNDFAAHFSAETGLPGSFITGHETIIHKENRPISYI